MDDAVLQVRVRSLLGYIGGLLQDRPIRELPDELQKTKGFVRDILSAPLFTGVKVGRESAVHTYALLEVLSKDPLPPTYTLPELIEACDSGAYSGVFTVTPSSVVPSAVMAELLMDQGSDAAFLDGEPNQEDNEN
jgi:hypothetical protein